jgi:hypothetical protein
LGYQRIVFDDVVRGKQITQSLEAIIEVALPLWDSCPDRYPDRSLELPHSLLAQPPAGLA